MLKDLLEFVTPSMAEARIDNEQRMVRGCVLFGSKESKNGYFYSEKAVQSLQGFSDGAKVYIDHESDAEKRARQGVRSMHDYAGVIGNVQRRGDKILGDWSVVESYWPLAKSIATQMPDRVGFSIAVKAFTSQENGKEIIEDLHSLSSIDLVSEGAVIANLFESLQPKKETTQEPYKTGTIIQIRESDIAIDVGESEPIYVPKRGLSFVPRISQEVALTHSKTETKKESKKSDTKEVSNTMTLTKEAMKGLEILGRKAESEDFEEAVLDVAATDRSPQASSHVYHETLDPNHFRFKGKPEKSNVDLTEENVLGAVTHDKGIEHGGGEASDINQFKSPEAVWEARRLELLHSGKPSSKDEDEVLNAVTRG